MISLHLERARCLRADSRVLRRTLVLVALELARTEEEIALIYDELAGLDDGHAQCPTACAAEARSAAERARRYAAVLRSDLAADATE